MANQWFQRYLTSLKIQAQRNQNQKTSYQAFKAYFDYEKGYIRTLVSVSLPQSLKIISDDGFWGQENLQEITLGSVVEIGQSAFGSCTMLKQITLPDTLTTIGWRAFESSGLTSLTIPVNVTSLGDSFITDCSALTSLYVAEGNPTYEMEDGLLYDIPAKTLRYALPDVSGDVVIRDGTVRIGDDVDRKSTRLNSSHNNQSRMPSSA